MENEDTGTSMETATGLNASVMLGMTLLYSLRRFQKGITPSVNFIKGRLRSISMWMAIASIIGYLSFLSISTFLSTKTEIERSTVELTRMFDFKYFISYRNYSIDLSALMINSIKVSTTCLVSSIFILVSLCEYESRSTSREIDFKSSIASLSKIWGIFRIPLILYLETMSPFINEKASVFARELGTTVEMFLAAFFLMIIKSRHSTLFDSKRSLENINLLSVTILTYSILKHAINLVDFPVILTETHLQIISSINLGLLISLYLLMVTMLCPIKKSLLESDDGIKLYKRNELVEECNSSVALVNSLIEFDEKKAKH